VVLSDSIFSVDGDAGADDDDDDEVEAEEEDFVLKGYCTNITITSHTGFYIELEIVISI
jgi:hypothetical protein